MREAVPRLRRVTEELDYFGRAVDGRFVPPGPSGAPTRGNAGLLPTGRNFYAIDPTAVPTRSAWKTGRLLGDQLLESFLAREGRYPENVVIVVYSGETMKTGGDDLAEILYLYHAGVPGEAAAAKRRSHALTFSYLPAAMRGLGGREKRLLKKAEEYLRAREQRNGQEELLRGELERMIGEIPADRAQHAEYMREIRDSYEDYHKFNQ